MSDSNEIVPVPEKNFSLGTLKVATSHDVIVKATEIAKDLYDLVEKCKLYTIIKGRKHVHVEGWETLGTMLGILPKESKVTRHEDGTYEAEVDLIRANDGMVIGHGSAIVSPDEPNWEGKPEYARRSMAITRATGKAYRLSLAWIMALAGYAPTPAEEMEGVVEGHFEESSLPDAKIKSPPKTGGVTLQDALKNLGEAVVVVGLDEIPPPEMHMELSTAMGVKSDEGKSYGGITSDKLIFMYRAIKKRLALPDISVDDKEKFQMKKTAIEVIAEARRKNEPLPED